MHPHDVLECIDVAASGVTWNSLNPEKILSCDRLVIRDASIDAAVQVFRPKNWGSKLLIRSSLASRLSKQGFVGLRFVDPATYTGVG